MASIVNHLVFQVFGRSRICLPSPPCLPSLPFPRCRFTPPCLLVGFILRTLVLVCRLTRHCVKFMYRAQVGFAHLQCTWYSVAPARWPRWFTHHCHHCQLFCTFCTNPPRNQHSPLYWEHDLPHLTIFCIVRRALHTVSQYVPVKSTTLFTLSIPRCQVAQL